MIRATLIPSKGHSSCGHDAPSSAERAREKEDLAMGSNSQGLPKKRATYLTLMGVFAPGYSAQSLGREDLRAGS